MSNNPPFVARHYLADGLPLETLATETDMGFRFEITTETADEMRGKMLEFFRFISSPTQPQADGAVEAEIVDPPVQPKRRGRPPKEQPPTIDVVPNEPAPAEMYDGERKESWREPEPPVDSVREPHPAAAQATEVVEQPPVDKETMRAAIISFVSDAKMKSDVVEQARDQLVERGVDISKFDLSREAARIVCMALIHEVGGQSISTIPEDKYGEVVALIEAKRAAWT
jgi:hypothetical protein